MLYPLDDAGKVDFSEYSYPYALNFPGMSHICDWLLWTAVSSLAWWTEYMEHSKILTRFLRHETYRVKLQEFPLRVYGAAGLGIVSGHFQILQLLVFLFHS